MATREQRITRTDHVLTTDADGWFTFSPFLTARSSAEDASVNRMMSMVTAAMPPALHDPFLQSDESDGFNFATELVHEFHGGQYPSWLAQLPETVQTYFISQWMGVILDRTDLLGSSSVTVTALVLTKGSGGITSTVAGSATFARSQSWHYMSVLTEHLPAAVLILAHDASEEFATGMYRQFTSGTAPSWFQAMPTDVQSFVVLDYLPNWLNEPMIIDMLALASPAARPTAATGPTGTTRPTPTFKPMPPEMDKTSSKKDVVVVAILVPLVILAVAVGLAIWFVRYRRRKRARSLASDLPPLDPEQAVRRWSETTFSTAVSPQEQRHQSSFLPPMTLMESPARSSTALRRTLSEGDLGQANSPGTKAKDLEAVETQSDRAELEARTAPLVKC